MHLPRSNRLVHAAITATLLTFAAMTSAAPASGKEFEARLMQRFPAMAGAKIAPAFDGFWSVIKGSEVLFVREDLSVLIAGEVIDLRTNQSITASLREANKPHVDPGQFDLADAIVIGQGARRLYVFSDPDCPYCRQLEPELAKLSDVQIYVFPFPLVGLHPNARLIAESIWCQKDRAGAWRAYLLNGQAPAVATCDNPISRNLLLGERIGVQGTPALVFEDGTVIPGAVSAQRIEAQLANAAAAATVAKPVAGKGPRP